MAESVEIPRPDDWHVHLRDDAMLAAVIEYTARYFRYGMVMPNLATPVVSTAQARSYRDRIVQALPAGSLFEPKMTLYCAAATDPADVRAGHADGVVTALKYYPAGATTNSGAGGSGLGEFLELFELCAELEMRLLVHAESTRADVDIFDREEAFLVDELAPLCERLPELAITVEHVSTVSGVDFVREHRQCVATITPHHLSRDRSDLLASGMRPDLYCKPIINSGVDREALVAAATSGGAAFFLGTDSAPHPTTSKYAPRAAAGVFNAAYALEVVADVFDRAGLLERLGSFVSHNGAAAYGVEPSGDRLTLRRVATEASGEVADKIETLRTGAGDEVVLFGTEEARRWTVVEGDS